MIDSGNDALEAATRRIRVWRLIANWWLPVFLVVLTSCVAIFGPYLYYPAEWAEVVVPLLLIGTFAPIAFAVSLNFRFRYGYIKCPSCGGPFVSPWSKSQVVPATCWHCHYSLVRPR